MLVQLREDADIRVLILRGAGGKAFAAGDDITQFVDWGAKEALAHYQHLEAFIGAIEAFPKPTIALIQGFAVGAGLEVAAACDLRIAAEDARFSIPEMEIGIPLGWGGVPRLIRQVGPTVAMELVLDCTPFDAAQALAWRFVNRVVPVDELDARGLEWAQRLAQRPLNALRTTKQRFSAAAETLCPAADSQADADALLAAYRDPETQQMQQRYIGARQR